jgi:ammonium transporter Rh
MVFVKKYGRSAVTATYLLVSVSVPLYIAIHSLGVFGESTDVVIDKLILAEFAAAALLICAGAVLGRLQMEQYVLLAILFIPCYMLNEWIVLGGGLGVLTAGEFVDTGGSIIIHAFGAAFGIAVAMTMTTEKEFGASIDSDFTSDRFSLLGSMVLWLFWPSFCAALVPPEAVPATALNVVIALCGATIATYLASIALRRKISMVDIANATLAGGVAIGSTCDTATPAVAFVIGILAGTLSTYGFAVLQPKVERIVKGIDTCGVQNLHGFPGILGGVSAMFVVEGIANHAQLMGIVVTLVVALSTGFVSGKILATFGRRSEPYSDAEEIIVED